MASGALSAARNPDLPGLDAFRGETYHTGRWPKTPVDFTGRKVAVIGTGSSGIQLIRWLRRSPSNWWCFSAPRISASRPEQAVAPGAATSLEDGVCRASERARNTRSGILYEYGQRGTFEVSEAERQAEYERRWARGGTNYTHAFNDVFVNLEANNQSAQFVRERIRATVRNPEVAEKLVPTDHPIGTKRVCVDTGYYDTFNRDNVTLVDIRQRRLPI